MKIQIGYGDTIYGTAEEDSDGKLSYDGADIEAMQNLIESMKEDEGQSDSDVLASLPEKLQGRLWADEVQDAEGDSSVGKALALYVQSLPTNTVTREQYRELLKVKHA